MLLLKGHLPQKRQSEREGEREREEARQREERGREKRKKEITNERKKERKKESERVRYQMIWQLQETRHHRLNFSHQYCRFCECRVPGYRFWGGPIALQGFVRICDTNSCNTSRLQPF